jgi:formamidopyrimidine-DNA glycosylase
MPELPEVETVRRGLAPIMEGALIDQVELRRADLRFAFPAGFRKLIEGRKVSALSRRAKYLMADLDDGQTIIMHLGMSGSFRIEQDEGDKHQPGNFHHERSKLAAHDHVVFHLKNGDQRFRIIYNDPRRFGFMDLVPGNKISEHKFFKNLGIEPVGNALSTQTLADLFAGKKAPLKAALLDQRLIAGLGNIYVCEAMHRSGLSPTRRAGSLVRKSGKPSLALEPLAGVIRVVIAEAIEAGGSSLRDHRQTDGSLGYFQHRFGVYDREGEPCPRTECNGRIRRIVQSGRSTFYCPKCQK